MIITVQAKYWGAFMRTTLRFDLQHPNSSQQQSGCGRTKQLGRLEFALEIVLLLRINKVVLKIVLKMRSQLTGCQAGMSGQAIISPGQQQRPASGVRVIPTMHMQIKVGSWRYVFYFNFIIFFWVMGWWDFRQLFEDFGHKTQGQELKDTQGQMDGRWIQENDGHCVRNCKQDGTSISGSSLGVTGQSTHEQQPPFKLFRSGF